MRCLLYPETRGLRLQLSWRASESGCPSVFSPLAARTRPPMCTRLGKSRQPQVCGELRSPVDSGSGEVLDLLENETGMHSCLVSNPNSPVGAGGKRRHPRGFESTGIGADKPEAR